MGRNTLGGDLGVLFGGVSWGLPQLSKGEPWGSLGGGALGEYTEGVSFGGALGWCLGGRPWGGHPGGALEVSLWGCPGELPGLSLGASGGALEAAY